jgi:hyaluronan synthase
VRGRHRAEAGHTRGRLSVILFMGLVAIGLIQWRGLPSHAQWYGLAVFAILAAKLGASTRRRMPRVTYDQQRELERKVVVAVVPMRNEDPDVLRRSLESLLEQTRPVNGAVIVDDASSDDRCLEVALEMQPAFAARGVDFRVLRFPDNQGKRQAIAEVAVQFPHADVYLGVDSDTVLDRRAVETGLRPFVDADVRAVTGLVLALNAGKNLLTRLIDLRYANAFLYERAAYSALGSVLCACGSLALYDGRTVRANLPDFLNQVFLRRRATYGDDRRLTNYCLVAGKVVFQPEAIAWTLVPEKIGHYLRQQVRWNKSFFRESIWVLANLSTRKPATWLTAVELTSWLVFTATLLWALLVQPFVGGIGHDWLTYMVFVCLLSYLRSLRYLEVSAAAHDRPVRQRLASFALAPLYGLIHLFVLLPLRVWSLATLWDNRWGTRQSVEVRLDDHGRDVPTMEISLGSLTG